MSKIKNFSGQRFGKLLAIKKAPSLKITTTTGRLATVAAHECQCDCGVVKVIPNAYLIRGSSKSCGCGEYERDVIPTIQRLYRYAKERIPRVRKKQFTLTFEEFQKISLSNCHYCNTPPSNKYRHVLKISGDVVLMYNGIDRMDNTLDYVPGNCVPCCARCNTMKSFLTYDEFIAHIKLLHSRLCV